MEKELFIGLNGILTFTKDYAQLDMAKLVPSEKLLLETDSPYLSPKPVRGQICKSEHVVHTAEFLAELRDEKLAEIADKTTSNACKLFDIQA